jgi:hypothetical protein
MEIGQPESKFVRMVMKDATEAEIAEATRDWFAYLKLLDTIASEVERRRADSSDDTKYVSIADDKHTTV